MTGDANTDVVTQVTREGTRPHGWDDLDSDDQKNIRRFLQRRQEQEGIDDDALYHDLSVLVGTASMVMDGPLSSAHIRDLDEPSNRPTRTPPHFLVFVGQHTPKCPECGTAEYVPAEKHPEKMRCRGCDALFTMYELASWPHSEERRDR